MVDVEKLIELVKNHEFLYDLSHRDYKNTKLKVDTWELIAKNLNSTMEICRLKWKTVRDSYLKYKRQLKNSDGTKDIDYIWRANLKFLDSHNVNRRSFYHMNKQKVAEADVQTRDEFTYEISSSPPPLAPLGSSTMAEVNSTSSSSAGRRPLLNIGNVGNSTSCQSNQDLRIGEDPIAKYKEIDATDLLFLSYSATFKKFPARQQTLMKLELAKLFANAELQQLDDAEQECSSVVAAESLPGVIKREYADKIIIDFPEEFSDITDMNEFIPRKRKRTKPQ